MIIVTVDYIPNDDRKFCAKWRACRVDKFSEDKIAINEYAYKDKDIPYDFWKKHTIYYVDTKDQNRLLKAYDLEDKWEDMQFTGDKFKLGVAGEITSDVLQQYLINLVTILNDKLELAEATMTTLKDKIDSNYISIEQLKTLIETNTANINSIISNMSELQDDINARATKHELNTAVDVINNSITSLSNQLQTSINSMNSNISESITSLSEKINNLEINAVMNNDTIVMLDESNKT